MADMKAYTTVFRLKPSGADPHKDKVHKRNRPPLSCLACRARKQKCDRAQPCGSCVRRGSEATCSYAPSPPAGARVSAGGAGSSGAAARGGRQEAQERLQRLEEMVHQLLERPEGKPTAS